MIKVLLASLALLAVLSCTSSDTSATPKNNATTPPELSEQAIATILDHLAEFTYARYATISQQGADIYVTLLGDYSSRLTTPEETAEEALVIIMGLGPDRAPTWDDRTGIYNYVISLIDWDYQPIATFTKAKDATEITREKRN